MALFMGWTAWRIQVNKLGSSDSLSLGDNKEEFTEGKESSVKLMNFYLIFFKYIESLDLKDFLSWKILLW